MANRKKQIEKLQENASVLSEEIGELIEELEEAYENLPDNLRQGQKGDVIQGRIDKLSEIRDQLSDFAEDDEI